MFDPSLDQTFDVKDELSTLVCSNGLGLKPSPWRMGRFFSPHGRVVQGQGEYFFPLGRAHYRIGLGVLVLL